MEDRKQTLLKSSMDRQEDGSLIINLQSDMLEDFFQKHAIIKGEDGNRTEFFPAKADHTAYRHERIERIMTDYIGRCGYGWGDFIISYEYCLQLLKIKGLKEGVRIILPRTTNHEWSQQVIDQMHAYLRDGAMKIYRRYLLPTRGELNITVTMKKMTEE